MNPIVVELEHLQGEGNINWFLFEADGEPARGLERQAYLRCWRQADTREEAELWRTKYHALCVMHYLRRQ